MRQKSFIVSLFVVLMGLVGIGQAQTLRVLDRAVVGGGSLMVGDVARLENMPRADAEVLAQTVVAEKAAARKIAADEILFALMTRSGRADLAAKIQVIGAACCEVSLEAAAPAPAAAPPPTVAAVAVVRGADNNQDVLSGASNQAGRKLSDLLCASVIRNLQVDAEDVRVSFDTVNSLLDSVIAGDTRWQIRPMTRVMIGTVQWEAQLLQNTNVLRKFIVQARVSRRTQAIVTVKPIGRGEILFDTQAVETQERWVDRMMPADTQLTKVDEVLGSEAIRSIPAGEVLDGRSFRKADMMLKGDTLTVWFVTSSLTIKGSARALSSGKLHERAECRNEISGEIMEGTVIGKRIIVVGNVDAATEARLRKES